MKCLSLACLSLILSALGAGVARADITLACGRATLRLSEQAVPRSLVLAADQAECLARSQGAFAEVQLADGAWHPANRASKSGDLLELGFRDTDTTLFLAVDARPDWLALRVASFRGARPAAVRFVRLAAAFTDTVGQRLAVGRDSAHALGVLAASPLTETLIPDYAPVTLEATVAAVNRGEGGVIPRACLTAQAKDAAGQKMEGAAAAIVACPAAEFRALALSAAQTYGLGSPFAAPPAGESYLDALGRAIRAGQPPSAWPTVKSYVDAGVSRLLGLRNDLIAGELAGIGFWPRHTRDGREIEGLQLDELEYLLCRSVAFDCPAPLQAAGCGGQPQNPLTPDLQRLAKAYEAARLGGRFSEAVKAPMREPGKEFTLLQRKGFAPVLVPVRPVACGGSHELHAMVGPFEGGSVATFWHASGSARVTLDLSPFIARVADFDDQRVVAQKSADNKLVLPVTTRRLTLFCPTLDAATLEQKIKNSLSTAAGGVYK